VILQGETAEDEEDVAAPLGVVGGLKIKNDRDEVLDVLDGSSLSVEVGDGRCFRGGGVDVVILRIGVVVRMLGAEAIPEGRGLLLQGICLRALFVKSSSSGADTLLGGGSGLEKGSSVLVERREEASSSRRLAAERASSRSLVAVAMAEELEVAMGARSSLGWVEWERKQKDQWFSLIP